MVNTFLYSDPHFGHANICKFKNYDGTPLRPWDDVAKMDEEMIQMFNETVRPNDKVYFLGDLAMGPKHLPKIGQLHGDKILIKGNHDIFKLKQYTEYFRDVRSYHIMNGLILSHIPINVDCLARFGCNIHGHLHGNQIMMKKGFWPFRKSVPDPRFLCVCVEHTGFKPIAFDDAMQRIKDRGGQVGFRNGNGPSID